MNRSQTEAASREVLGDIASQFDRLFVAMEPVASGFARMAALVPLVREGLSDLRGAISEVLASQSGLIGGAGVIPTPGLLTDAPYWMEWWWTAPGKEPEALRVNLEPSAPDFFEYPVADWFATPRATGKRHIAGPYVDYVCTNAYAMTLALPVRARGEFVGVAAVDVTIAGWERRILPLLGGLSAPMTLTNAAGRVIASTSPLLSPGRRLDLSTVDSFGDGSDDSPSFGWRLVADDEALRSLGAIPR